jgi:hypothetical protein
MRALIAVLAVVAALPAWAGLPAETVAVSSSTGDWDIADLPRNRLGVGIFFQDVVALTPGTGGFIAPVDGAVIGVAGTYQRRVSLDSGWFLDAGAGYGVGKETVQVFQPFAFRDVTSFTAAFARAGLGYEVRLSRHASAHASGGLFYSRTRATFDNGGSKVDGERFNAFGIDEALGGRLDLHGGAGLYGEHYTSFGWGSGRGPDAKYSASVKYGCYRGGLIVGF